MQDFSLISGSHSRFLLGFTGFCTQICGYSDIFRDFPGFSPVSPLRTISAQTVIKNRDPDRQMISLIADSVHIIGTITRTCERSLLVMCFEDPPRCQRSVPVGCGGNRDSRAPDVGPPGTAGPRGYGPDTEPEEPGRERTNRRVPS